MGLFLCTYTLLYIESAEIYVCSVPNWIVGYHFYFCVGREKFAPAHAEKILGERKFPSAEDSDVYYRK